jgi:hypothetical protein
MTNDAHVDMWEYDFIDDEEDVVPGLNYKEQAAPEKKDIAPPPISSQQQPRTEKSSQCTQTVNSLRHVNRCPSSS